MRWLAVDAVVRIVGDHERLVGLSRVIGREAIERIFGNGEAGVDHSERIEEVLLQERVERPVAEDFHESPAHVGRERVVPRGAGVELERQVAEQLDEAFEVDVLAANPGFPVELVDGMARIPAVGEAGRVREHVADLHRSLGLDKLQGAVVVDEADALLTPLGQVAVHRIGEFEQAALVQAHRARPT